MSAKRLTDLMLENNRLMAENERLRAQVESLTEQLTLESIDTTCHCAAKSAADCGCPGAVWPEDRLRAEVVRLRAHANGMLLWILRVMPYVCHSDSCGDLDAFNGVTGPDRTCGCGLQSILEAALKEQP
jgi:hypothetical protein